MPMNTGARLGSILSPIAGHYRYYGILDNSHILNRYCYETKKLLVKLWN